MSDTASDKRLIEQEAQAFRGISLYEKLVLSAFSKMTRGHMTMVLPSGEVWKVGSDSSELRASMRVWNPCFFEKCVLFGDVGFGESYVDGDWDTDSIEALIRWAILNVDNSPGLSGSRVRTTFLNMLKVVNRIGHKLRPNSRRMSRRNIADHYDLGNDFYALWLDSSMTYSSGVFRHGAQTLEQAQAEKYEALCRGLRLKAQDHVLEIGTGWGGFCVHAARQYGCRVTSVTISQQQYEYAKARVVREGLDGRVEVLLKDYREVSGRFDKVVSIEMMEALGERYLEAFCRKIDTVLKAGGLVALQYITVPDSRHGELRKGIDWIQKHIFPGSLLLSVGRVNRAFNGTSELFLHQLEDLGVSYARTLRLWWERFNERQTEVLSLGFDPRFIRKWNYYLQYCEAAFASRNISVVQAVYTRPNNEQLHVQF